MMLLTVLVRQFVSEPNLLKSNGGIDETPPKNGVVDEVEGDEKCDKTNFDRTHSFSKKASFSKMK